MQEQDTAALAELITVEAELNRRWPETKIEPSLTRISALMDLLGQPQRAYPVIQVAGTNGKTSVTRMIDALLTATGLRTGRFTSPHLQSVTERIALDDKPISAQQYLDVYHDIEPYLSIVDKNSEVSLSKFEVLTAMGYAAFADAPVDVAIVEVGMGGRWDCTNVVDAQIAVITPVGMDHTDYLGETIEEIAGEKAGIIKPDAIAVVAEQDPAAMGVILREVGETDSIIARQGGEFGVLQREVAVGGQRLLLQGLGGEYDDIFLPLHGAHQAANAAVALAAVEAFFGAGKDRKLDVGAVRQGFLDVAVPGRIERVRTAPTVLLDAAHNPHGATALAAAIDSEFAFRKLVGVVAMMADKDVKGVLRALEPVLTEVVITSSSAPRAMHAEELAGYALAIFGEERIQVRDRVDEALELAVTLAEEVADPGELVSGAGVLVTGSVVTAGEARALLGKDPR